MKEIFKPIIGYEGLYDISNLGRVKSLKYGRTGKERMLKAGKDNDGYLYVDLSKDGVHKHFFVHRLVAEAFIPNPENKPCIDHIVPVNEGGGNETWNLRWCTQKENCNNEASLRHYSEAKKGEKAPWYGKFGAEHPKSKPIVGVHKKTGEEVSFPCAADAKRILGISDGSISKCCKGQLKSAGGWIWYYA